MEKELWKTVPYAQRYEVSTLGQIRNKVTNHILRPRLDRYGYPKLVMMSTDHKLLYKTVHRVVAETWLPDRDISLQVNHIDGNKENARLDNLEWNTAKQNIIHSYETLLNTNTSHVVLIDLRSGKKCNFRSIKNLSKYLNVSRSSLVPLIKESRRNPIYGYYCIDVVDEAAMFGTANTKNFGDVIYCYDALTRETTQYPSILLATYHTGIRSLSNIRKNGGYISNIGYQLTFDVSKIDKDQLVDVAQISKDREAYLLAPYRKQAEKYFTYDYISKREYEFSTLEEITEFFRAIEPKRCDVTRRRIACAIGQITKTGRSGLFKGYGVKSNLQDIGWFPYTEEVLLSNRNGLRMPHIYYRIHRGNKSELALGHSGLCEALGYSHRSSYQSFDYKAVVEMLNIPNLRVDRLNKPITLES